MMGPIRNQEVQMVLERFQNKMVYLHLETTNGAYAAHRTEGAMTVCAYIRNGQVQFHNGKIIGDGPFRVGLEMENGWIYAEGITDWELDSEGRLLLAGYDADGKLAVALELSEKPFTM